MGLMSFMKEAGEKLFGRGEAKAAQEAAAAAPTPEKVAALSKAAGDAIGTYVKAQGLTVNGMDIGFDAPSATVTVAGTVADQTTKEKVLLCCGNVAGVEKVNDLLVVDKPAGLLTIGTESDKTHTAYFLLTDYVRKGCARSRNRVFIVHRLDRDTSGVLLAARTDAAFERMRVEFELGRVVKIYFAIVHGRPDPEGVVCRPLASRGRRASRVEVVRDEFGARGLRGHSPAETHYSVLRAYRGFSLVRLRMTTGARHQLRAHMAFLGHPVAGDPVYGRTPRDSQRQPERHLLHAAELRFFHPLQGKPIQIRSPLPADMRSFLKQLQRT